MQLNLPPDLSAWQMFLHADWIVQTVMIGLTVASIATWTVLVAKTWELRRIGHALRDARFALARTARLSEAQIQHPQDGIVHELLEQAHLELQQSAGLEDKFGIKERIASRLERVELAYNRHLRTGTGVLATIGATAPFVGLFGTVWGILNALIKIGQSGDPSISAVAGPVGEALIMTAVGLVVAVPAVMAYNWLQARNKAIGRDLGIFANDVLGNIMSNGQVRPATVAKAAAAAPAAAPKA